MILYFKAAERMLNLLLSIESNVEGYIYEVLHREYLNIVADFEINSMDSIDTNPDYSWLFTSNNAASTASNDEVSKCNDKPMMLNVDCVRVKQEPTTASNDNNDAQTFNTLNYDDLIDCLSTAHDVETTQNATKLNNVKQELNLNNKQQSSSLIKTNPIQNLNEIFNKQQHQPQVLVNSNGNTVTSIPTQAINLIESPQQQQQQQQLTYNTTNTSNTIDTNHHYNFQTSSQPPQMLNLVLVSGGVGFLSVVKNN